MKITGIMACTRSGVIGKEGKVPWNYPDEFAHFQKTTLNNTVIMGRKTFLESDSNNITKNRFNIVFSRDTRFKQKMTGRSNVVVVASIDEFLAIKKIPRDKKIFMIGGAEIAKLFFENNLLDDFILTIIQTEYLGEIRLDLKYFPQNYSKLLTSTVNFSIYYYKIPKTNNYYNKK